MRLAHMMRIYIAAMSIEQKSVAQACGCSESTMSRFLAEKQMPDAAAFARIIAWCCNVDVPQIPQAHTMDPNARIGGPDAPYRKETKERGRER